MVSWSDQRRGGWRALQENGRIIWALILRELGTRYGRDNLGFIWVFGEPLLFFTAVLTLWSAIKSPFEHGIRLAPFLMTGYLPILMMRHMIGHTTNTLKANAGLLYHRRITVQHLFFARLTLEFIGVTLAFFVVYVILGIYGVVQSPDNLGLMFAGWFLLGWVTFGVSMIVGAISEMVDVFEKLVSALTYILVPISGMFYMAEWIPEKYRPIALLVPFLNCVEMIRGGVFGDSVITHFSVIYVVGWGVCTTFLGVLLLRFLRSKVEVD